DIRDSSRVLYYRNIVVRARTALPFLQFDRDPYLVLADDGTLQWILDAYTTSDDYPYAQRLADGTTYMRNSVKVVIDAYNGSLRKRGTCRSCGTSSCGCRRRRRPSTSTWFRSHRGGRTTWRPGWWRGTTARSTGSSGCTGYPGSGWCSGPSRSKTGSTKTPRS